MYTFDPFDTTDDQTANNSPMVAPAREPVDLDEVGTGTGYQTPVGVGDRSYNSTVVEDGTTDAQPTGRFADSMGTPGVGTLDEMALGSRGFRLDDMGGGGGDTSNGDGFDPTTYEL